ncbi:MAG TPA: prepilin-type N-terminal cleavage/methylation domain-containing protein [Galbitalea sp.]|jgi:prepilin-type N-terminal cleavage/methylation domain-containing protein
MNAHIACQFRRLRDEPDSGLSLIEVVIAMMVFAIIATGVAYSLVATLHTAKDGKGREVALNLAAQQIDADRAVSDIFSSDLNSGSRTVRVPGDSTVYTVKSSISWVTSNGTAANCGAGSGTLQFKQVNVTVTWPGMIASNPVRADTIIAPQTTINDPTLGTILVSVKDKDGIGVPGVAITTTPSTGTTVPVTDADGCSYILKVPPGTYSVNASLSGYIDGSQSTNPSSGPKVVTAGSVTPAGFSMDQSGSLVVNYASNYSGTVNLPTNLLTSFSSTIGGVDQLALPAGGPTSGNAYTYPLYPYSSYTVNAGGFLPATQASAGCLDVDPTLWPDGTVAGKNVTAPAAPTSTVTAGQSLPLNVPMGVVTLTVSTSSRYYSATTVTPASSTGDPGCAPSVTYNFGSIKPPSSGKIVVALPYGTYSFKSGSQTTNLAALAGSKVAATTGTTGVLNGNNMTLDPREPA